MPRSSSPRGRGGARTAKRGGSDARGGPTQRQLRVGEMLRHALAEILNRNEIRDPDLDGVSVVPEPAAWALAAAGAGLYWRGRRVRATAG